MKYTNTEKLYDGMNGSMMLKDIAEALEMETETTTGKEKFDRRISEMTSREVFKNYCDWHGLMGWSEGLYDLVVKLEKSKTSNG